MDRRHSAPSGSRRLSSVKLDFNTLGRYLSPRVSPVVKANKSAPAVMNKKTPRNIYKYSLVPSPHVSPPRKPYHNSLIPTPLAPLKSPRKSPQKQEQLVLPVKAPASPKKPTNISPAKPKTPLVIPSVKPKTKLSFFSRNRIHPVAASPVVAASPAVAPVVHIVPNKSLELPDKLVAIYYVGLIYETIRRLAKEIREIVEGVSKLTYIQPPIFNIEAVGKLEELIKDIERDTHIYPRKLKEPLDIKQSFLFARYLIKKPTNKDEFLKYMIEIMRYQKDKKLNYLEKKNAEILETLKKRGASQEQINKIKINKFRKYETERRKLDKKRDDYIASIEYPYQDRKMFKKTVDTQNRDLPELTLKDIQYISHKEFEEKLQSLNDTMNEFLGIVNNILSADVEPSRTGVSGFTGGYILFAKIRYNSDDKEYTPLVYRYIDANRKNFLNVLEYFNRSYEYFTYIEKRIADRYASEYKNVVMPPKPVELHPEYNSKAIRNAIVSHPTHPTYRDIDTTYTTAAISRALLTFRNIENRIAVIKDCDRNLDNMKDIVDTTHKEIDYIYHSV